MKKRDTQTTVSSNLHVAFLVHLTGKQNATQSAVLDDRKRYPSHTNVLKRIINPFINARCLLKVRFLKNTIKNRAYSKEYTLFLVHLTGIEPAPSCPD